MRVLSTGRLIHEVLYASAYPGRVLDVELPTAQVSAARRHRVIERVAEHFASLAVPVLREQDQRALAGLEGAGLQPEFFPTRPAGETVAGLADRLEHEDVARVIYLGGDGTFAEAAKGIILARERGGIDAHPRDEFRRLHGGGGEAPVGDRFLDDHGPPGRVGLRQRVAGRGFEHVPGRLHRFEDGPPVDGRLECPADRLGLAGARGRQPDLHAAVGQLDEAGQHGPILEHAGVERGRVDLEHGEAAAEQRRGFAPLPIERVDGVILDLVDLGVDPPAGGVGVAPF